jgi:iron complex outermembrane recepter protein
MSNRVYLKNKSRSIRSAFMTGVAAPALILMGMSATAAFAQDNDDDERDVVIVTGTRLAITPEQSPTPLAVLSDDYIAATGETNLADVLRELPATGASGFTATNTIFSTAGNGINGISLRNLGTGRTVVLVNGRRYVSGVAGSSIVDFNTIPTDFVQRVEVITGGASAQYGADAVAGVINLITRKAYDGVEFKYQYGTAPKNNDGQRHKVTATIGEEFDSGRGGFILNFTYDKVEDISCFDRTWCRIDALGAGGGANMLAPIFSSGTPLGRFDVDGGGLDSLSAGDDFVIDPVTGLVRQYNGSTDGYNRSEQRLLQIPVERMLFASNVDYELSDNVSFFFEGMYANSNGFSEIEPQFGDTLITGLPSIPVTNPFCPADICNLAIANGQTELGYAKRLIELGNRGQDFKRSTFRFASGFTGTVFDDVNWDFSYVYGRTDDNQNSSATISPSRMRFALDVEPDGNGGFQCVDAFARGQGCVPLNLFGLGSITPDMAAWIGSASTRDAQIEQQVAYFNLNGNADRWFNAPGGSVTWAAGVEYRKESSATNLDSATNIGDTSGNALPDVIGDYDVIEGYFETNIPLVSDASWTKDLNVSGAIRVSDYSTVGRTTAWNVGLVWAPVEDIRFRAKRAVAVRAPNIGELFQPLAQTFPTIADPCQDVTATSTGTNDAACRAIPEVASAIARDGSLFYTQEFLQSVTGFNGGNVNVKEETARSWTAGVVIQPRWFENFSLVADYYRINVSNAIQSPPRNVLILQNVQTGDFSDLVMRFSNGASLGRIQRVDAINTNIGGLLVEGLDIGLKYNLPEDQVADLVGADIGEFSLSANYQRLFNLITDTDGTPGGIDVNTNEIFAPKDQMNANIGWKKGRFRLQYNIKWTGSSVLDDINVDIADFPSQTVCNPSCNVNLFGGTPFVQGPITYSAARIDGYFQHDLQARWQASDSVELYAGVNNLFDSDPVLFAENTSGNLTTGLPTDGTTQINQIIGRFIYFGVEVRPGAIAKRIFK